MDFLLNEKYRPRLLAAIGALVFANSFWGRFVFDEYSNINQNEGIKHLWPLDCIFSHPNDTRPVIGVSLAINYAMHGMHYWTYHLTNLAIHLIAALALYGIVRRTLQCERLRERFGADAGRLAFFIALLWMVHPLQTASVTYIIQRCESMMGMFFLLTLYCVIRGNDESDLRRWNLLAVVFCALGMGCKQVMVTAPVIVLLYDRAFMGGSFVKAIRRRAWLYFWLCATGLILVTSATTNAPGLPTAGFGLKSVTPYRYALTQFGVIPHYLKLALWPATLCLDYVWPMAQSPKEVLAGLSVIGVLLALTLYGVLTNAAWGFLGAWFFVILAPSSSILPIQDAIFEHRMYLPLAALGAAFVLFADWFIRRLIASRSPWGDTRQARMAGAWFFAIVCCALSVRTLVRNADYWSEERIWGKVLDVYPTSQRAMQNYGDGLAKAGKHAEALEWFQKLQRVAPDYADGEYNVAVEFYALGHINEVLNPYLALEQKEEALKHYARVLELSADYPKVHTFMGDILRELHRDEHAFEHYEAELRRDPRYTDAYFGLGAAYEAVGNKADALAYFERALELDAKYPEIHYRLGGILLELERTEEAIKHFEAALRRDPHNAETVEKLAQARTKMKRPGV